MKNFLELFQALVVIALFWSISDYWVIGRERKKVLSNPKKYSSRKVQFFRNLTRAKQAVLSFAVSLGCIVLVIAMGWIFK